MHVCCKKWTETLDLYNETTLYEYLASLFNIRELLVFQEELYNCRCCYRHQQNRDVLQ